MAKAAYDVIIDHAHCLHVRVNDGAAHELEAPTLQVLAEGVGLRGSGGNIL